VAAVLAALLIGGCGGGEGDTSSAPTPVGMHDAELARDCLVGAGFDVVGGPRPRGDKNAPDVELVVQKPGPGAFLAFYKKLERARLYEPALKRNARRVNGSVVRNGSVSVLWVHAPASTVRKQVQGCAFDTAQT
jgi:hypothetical protein